MARPAAGRKTEENRPLTGLRGAAALLVMFYHQALNPRFADFAAPMLSKGYLAVDVFFVLSGFVIALRYAAPGTRLSAADYSRFMIARIARIYPAYILIVILYMVRWKLNFSGANYNQITLGDVFLNVILVQGWGVGAFPVIDASWSVSAEMASYLLFPVLAFFACKRGAGAAALTGLVAIGCIYLVTCSGLGIEGALDVVESTSQLPVLRALAGFTVGLLCWRLSRQGLVRGILGHTAFQLLAFASLAACIYWSVNDFYLFLLIPVIVISVSCETALSMAVFANPVSLYLGAISYSTYLLHPIFRDVAARASTALEGMTGVRLTVPFLLLGIVATCLAATACYRYVEGPGRRAVRAFGDRFLFPRSQPQPT